ncbi:hypothetical protein XYCOK13_32990 [Xylanibacillus composti]|uniref:Uncharacterized protein n=1 Tax=Xylanibacillus composti TaxID=1572762 RepID=A0A8J4M3V3_9BACL|nr:hypothetical protein XYCOK13_32990 [Xylanibacillus composti]
MKRHGDIARKYNINISHTDEMAASVRVIRDQRVGDANSAVNRIISNDNVQ